MPFATSSSDHHYLQALALSEEAAFDALFTRYYPGLVRYAKTLLPYPTDAAEDVTADVFCTLWTNRAHLVVQGSLASYLYTAVKHRAYDKLRQQRRTPLRFDEDELSARQPEFSYLEPDHLLTFQELNQQVLHLIDKLPNQTRTVFQLHREGNLTYEEIASLLTISINSVKTHMFRALRFLKSALHVSGTL
ncbi:RNA polymerase sigma-70 factor [Hymenobacter sp. GOD-10R]|uniref:RNA polymerase sigma-70 factor n=1 Tax=Hymenobacter sp. GOD-10R TaxID=3093922 RepID=UPI002D7952D0|nr:RNA polymerase sigma-70 factor [Hymenobacter sp. GOD-10R]WRQ26842.1 RNA polymerase sigma-70 factor [Hymenobacter sp. GOD-10R]